MWRPHHITYAQYKILSWLPTDYNNPTSHPTTTTVRSKLLTYQGMFLVILSGVMVIVLAYGPKVHGFKPGPEQWIFKGNRNP